jgi:Arc/MetJ-type ribon-helix-helix transcriptional regulator
MIAGMTAKKIAISVPEKTLAGARRAVKSGKATSLSAYISRAIEQKNMSDDLDSLLDEMLRETGGPLTPDEKAWADAALSGKPIAMPVSLKAARKGRK